jgi:hypothetical protein
MTSIISTASVQSPPSSNPPRDLGSPDLGEVYLETTAIGGSLKVSAIHVETGIEVSSMAPLNAARADIERLMIGKLRARLKREGRI